MSGMSYKSPYNILTLRYVGRAKEDAVPRVELETASIFRRPWPSE
jgi:hypothetical protein